MDKFMNENIYDEFDYFENWFQALWLQTKFPWNPMRHYNQTKFNHSLRRIFSSLCSLILWQLVWRPPNATAAAFFLLEVNYSIIKLQSSTPRSASLQSSSDINMASSFKEKVSNLTNPSALTVLTAMLFWGQVQNYMMRINLRYVSDEDSHHHYNWKLAKNKTYTALYIIPKKSWGSSFLVRSLAWFNNMIDVHAWEWEWITNLHFVTQHSDRGHGQTHQKWRSRWTGGGYGRGELHHHWLNQRGRRRRRSGCSGIRRPRWWVHFPGFPEP